MFPQLEEYGYTSSQDGCYGTELADFVLGRKASAYASKDWGDQEVGWAGAMVTDVEGKLNLSWEVKEEGLQQGGAGVHKLEGS